MDELDLAIALNGKDQVIEQVAYTWFNRFSALRFMDANGYTSTGIVSPAAGQTRPELLAEAMAGNIPDTAPASIAAILDGSTPSADPQAEAYRLLLVHACNEWHGPMPFLFEKLDDFSELLMPEDLLSQASILAEMRKAMTDDVCQDVEIIGWLYQFYISEKKDQVFAGLKKKQKITAENIPAATQLFTPHWIVRYLVENSLGRLWLLNRPASKLAAKMDYYIAPEEPETDFLRISKPEEIKICDPACGSGHMLTYAFDLLYAIYEEEGYEPTEIPGLILTHNLHGIEIDDRAGALAAFALSMKAAMKLGRRRFLKLEAKPNICVLQNVQFSAAEMQDVLAVVGSDLFTNDFRETMGQFEQAKNFGSLIVPKLRDPAEAARLVRLKDFSRDLLLREVQARMLQVLEMAESLTSKYLVVVANPPYLDLGNMNPTLKSFMENQYPTSKQGMDSSFIESARIKSIAKGYFSLITQRSWMFLSRLEDFRVDLIRGSDLRNLLYLGPDVFPEIAGEKVQNAAFIFKKMSSGQGLSHFIDVSDLACAQKEKSIRAPSRTFRIAAEDCLSLPGSPVAFWAQEGLIKAFNSEYSLGEFADIRVGLDTGDNACFLRAWYEVAANQTLHGASTQSDVSKSGRRWVPHTKGGEYRKWYGNLVDVISFSDPDYAILSNQGNKLPSREFYFREGIFYTRVSSGAPSFRVSPKGAVFNSASPTVFTSAENFYNVIAFLNSKVCEKMLECLSPTLNFQAGEIRKLPFNADGRHSEITRKAQDAVEISKLDWNNQEISWEFTANSLLKYGEGSQVIGDCYEETRSYYKILLNRLCEIESDLNRHFASAFDLQEEIDAAVSFQNVSLICNPAYRYGMRASDQEREERFRSDTMAEFLSYAVGCMFGRYSLDEPGLILANQGETLADYLARVPAPTFMPDEDNVIPVLDGDWFGDDVTERFRLFLRVTFGEEHIRENLKFIEDSLGKDIRRYFIKDFYADHVKRYKKRPIYWMFSSPKGTFNALIYMHRYRPDTVSILLNDYLREFISKLEGERGRLERLSDDPGASQAQRTKAMKDVGVVAKQIDELNDWERDVIFPLAQAKIEIDLDDGVKANYPKFGTALKRIPGLEEKDD